ncbi:MAG: Asp-tRNA(Asn)/Glu-tRNA(Gln) amidotransferase subunit GatC [Gammaproteobacteria bacterium]|nr:Asp-tRNA(Asn)/Glu-tRNA(Gln) amidotransferase subunit GatC [Gammaproteobacteria bacterium]
MALDKKEVESIAHLARIGLSESELEPLAVELSGVLEMVEQLNEADTTQVEPLAHPGVAELRLREDKVLEPNDRENLQSQAPAAQDGYFLVPKVIE